MGAATGALGAVGTDGALGAVGTDDALGAVGATGALPETGGEEAVGATMNLLQQRGIGDRPRSIIRRQNFLPRLVLQKKASDV
jgi:hypothetical protein